MGSNAQSLTTRFFLLLEKPRYAFLLAFFTYFLLSTLGGSPLRLREFAYFNYLADSFLHGQLYLRILPEAVHDLSFFNGHYYLYWPPMPAVILMPLVAVFGVNFSDVLFNLFLASANVAVLAALLRSADRAGLIQINPEYRGMLLLFFALGTAHVTIAIFGQVWYTAQLLGILLIGLTYLSAIELKGMASFLVTGALLACAMVTRNHLLFTGIWPAYHLITKNWNNRPKLYLYMGAGLLPALLLGSLFLAYNYARFGDPLEVGIRYHNMAPVFVMDYQKYGAFNLHYVPINFYYQYLHYPFPFDNDTFKGSSLFLLSPVFFYAFVGIYRRYRDPNIWFWLLSIVVTSIPILLLMGTGWVQYGPRYTLDFVIPMLLITASGLQGASRKVFMVLIILSILHYIPGVYLYVRLGL